jgi:multidrug transporter EmrE-like cation transporter
MAQNTKTWAIILVCFCTLVTATGQILLKIASDTLALNLIKLITNYMLILGCIVYLVGAVMLIIALKGGELSILYPIFSLTFIWVTIASKFIFGELISPMKWVGIILIILGVSLIGVGSK